MPATETNSGRSFIENALLLIIFLIFLYLLYSLMGIFLGVFTYAIILSVSFSSLFERMVKLLNNKRSLAATLFAILAIAIIALPFIFMINAAANYIHQGQVWYEGVKTNGVPPLPEWVSKLPFGQEKIKTFWAAFSADYPSTISMYDDQIKAVFKKLISGGLGIMGAAFELVIGIILATVLLNKGSDASDSFTKVISKITGDKWGPDIVNSAGKAIMGVSVGVMGTAFIEGALTWVGFAIEGNSMAPALAFIVFFLAVIQAGPVLVWIPMMIWQFSTGQTSLAIMSTIALVVLVVVDNVVKPILIGKSGKLPILVLFIGVVGGMSAWGFTGMFKGAIIMAVLYTLMQSWVDFKSKSTDTDLNIDPDAPLVAR
jgi:predicted PurR-regulated permease PerM